jgi:hypothetical protein
MVLLLVFGGLIGVFLMVAAVQHCVTKPKKKMKSTTTVPTTTPNKKTVEQDLEDATTTSDSPSTE